MWDVVLFEVNEENGALHRGRGIVIALPNNWEYSLILYQTLTSDAFLKVNFSVIAETMLRKFVQLKWINFKNGEICLAHGMRRLS